MAAISIRPLCGPARLKEVHSRCIDRGDPRLGRQLELLFPSANESEGSADEFGLAARLTSRSNRWACGLTPTCPSRYGTRRPPPAPIKPLWIEGELGASVLAVQDAIDQ